MRELQGRQAGAGGETCADLGLLLESSKWSSGSLDEHVRPNVAVLQPLSTPVLTMEGDLVA